MKKLFTSLLLLVFALALTGCASEISPTAEPTEPVNENASQEDGMDNQTEAKPVPEGLTGYLTVFDTLESFLGHIQRGTLPEPPEAIHYYFDVAENKDLLVFPRQRREIYQLERIEYNDTGSMYDFAYRDEVSGQEIGIEIQFDREWREWASIHEHAQFRRSDPWINYEIFEIIDDKYLLTKTDRADAAILLCWFDEDRRFTFAVYPNRGRTVDRERFFEIFENFRFVDFATMEREVLGQEVAE